MFGYTGKMLFVNLTNHSTEVKPLSEEVAKNFLGGPALGAKVLYDEMPANADVFGEESMIGFVSGPLNNSGAYFGGRYTVVSKSPVTGGFNDANSGGFFGTKLKMSGYDAVFVKGISKAPVYIYIYNEKVEILSAEELWGKTTSQAESYIKEKHGKNCCAALIGPGGENLSNIAAVMSDGHRAAARGGSGAVMGSKNLKAVVVDGNIVTHVNDYETLVSINREITQYMATDDLSKEFSELGTGHDYVKSVVSNDASIKNWTGSPTDYTKEDATPLSSQELNQYRKDKFCCPDCTMACSSFLKVPSKRWDLSNTPRPEYETMGAFGSMMMNKDIEAVCRCNDLCNEYGLDTISAGAIIAWLMECYNEGIFTQAEIDEIDLTWGNGDSIVTVLEKMCKNEGIGKTLLKGALGAAKELGKGEQCLAVAGGIEVPQHDSRLYYGLGRVYLSDPTPGRHVKGGLGGSTLDADFDPEKSFEHTGMQDMLAVVDTEVMNSSGMCSFGFGIANPNNALFRNLCAVTGFHYSPSEYMNLGLRMYNIRQAFNVREGLRRADYSLSDRMWHAKPPYDGPIKDVKLDFNILIDNLFSVIGWGKDGVPTKKALQNLGGLEDVIKDIYGEDEAVLEASILKAEEDLVEDRNKYFLRPSATK